MTISNKRPRKRSEKREDLARRIMDSSLELFMKHGYSNTTTRQILQSVGILNGSLYNIFESKDDILAALLTESIKECMLLCKGYRSESSGFVDDVLFPVCLAIHASDRCVRIAEMLSVANKDWGIMQKSSDMLLKWALANGHVPNIDVDDFRRRMFVAGGMLGSITEIMMMTPGTVDSKGTMHLAADIITRVLGIDTDVSERVDRFYDIVTTEDIMVCGLHINGEDLC